MHLFTILPWSKRTCERSLFILERNRLKMRLSQLIHTRNAARKKCDDTIIAGRAGIDLGYTIKDANELGRLEEDFEFSLYAKVDDFLKRCLNKRFSASVHHSEVDGVLWVEVEYFNNL